MGFENILYETDGALVTVTDALVVAGGNLGRHRFTVDEREDA